MNIPGLSQAIDNIRVGSTGADGSAPPVDRRESIRADGFTNSALQKQNTNYEQSQKAGAAAGPDVERP